MPLRDYPNTASTGMEEALRQIIGTRPDDKAAFSKVEQFKMPGRVRTGIRAVPTSATDVVNADLEGDLITDATYLYRLVNVSGVLKWHRTTLSIGW